MKGACLLLMYRSVSQSYLVKIHLIASVEWDGQSDSNPIRIVSLETHHFHEFCFYNNSRRARRE